LATGLRRATCKPTIGVWRLNRCGYRVQRQDK
jgi:hypothetical protein